MAATYLIRFDDLCPTMNWGMWQKIESVLLEHEISPLLAIVPDNRDDKLAVEPTKAGFWDEVQKWQARGWTIGLHGYQHLYVTRNAGTIGIHARSEFAGLPLVEQEHKLQKAIETFRIHGIEPEVWIAPAHSFDSHTVNALAKVGISTISDGLALAPHTDADGMFWVPQQLWRFRWRPFGVWTVCYHHNRWGETEFRRFLKDIRGYRDAITDLSHIRAKYGFRRHSLIDRCYSIAHLAVLSWRLQLRASA